MRILYDGQIYKYQAAGGISRYFANLISKLPQSFTPHLTVTYRDKVLYPTHPNLKALTYKQFRPLRLSNQLEKYYFRSVNDFNVIDIAHPTYYSLLTKQKLSQYQFPVVITVYDLIHEIFRARMDPSGKYW